MFSFVARDLLRLTESTSTAGRLLSALATEQTFAQPGFAYFSNRLIGPVAIDLNQRTPAQKETTLPKQSSYGG